MQTSDPASVAVWFGWESVIHTLSKQVFITLIDILNPLRPQPYSCVQVRGLGWQMEGNYCACVGHCSGEVLLSLEPAARSVPATCAAREFDADELRLPFGGLGAHCLCFTKQMST